MSKGLRLSIGKWVVIVVLFIIILTSALINLNHDYLLKAKVNKINYKIQSQNILNVIDQDRRTHIKKTVDIISRFNTNLNSNQKENIASEIYIMSQKYPNLNVDFINATITHESAKTWNPMVTSHVGAMGLMQVMPATGAFLAVEEGLEWTTPEKILFDPIKNIQLGCRYLSDLVTMYDKDGGLAAYNAGPRHAERWLASNKNNNLLYSETRNYIPAVLKWYDEFRSIDVM